MSPAVSMNKAVAAAVIPALQMQVSEPCYRQRRSLHKELKGAPVIGGVPCELTKGFSLRVRPSGRWSLGFPGGDSGKEHAC